MDGSLRSVLSDVGCGVLVVVQRRVELVNPALLALFRVERSDWVGAEQDELLAAITPAMTDGDAFRERCAAAESIDRPANEDLAMTDGRVLECEFQPVGSGTNRLGHLWLVWDVSPDRAEEVNRIRRQRAEIIAGQLGAHAHRARADEAEQTGRRLAARNEALAAVDATRKQLLATASHELRTPLTSILSFSELLHDAPSADAEVMQYAEIVNRNARRLLATVEDLLMLASLGGARHALDHGPVDVGLLVGQTVEELGPTAHAAGVDMVIDGPSADEAPAVVDGNAVELARMLTNVVGNAVKYSEPGGRVHVQVTTPPGLVRLTVGDEGVGIPADEIDLVFGQFYRSSTARTSDRPGTGLGLAVAQGIVVQHGGTIALTSELGRGTTVTVDLPVPGA